MYKKLLICFYILLPIISIAQNERIIIYGKLSSDSLSVDNVHIVNQNTKIGTLSNLYGEFKIIVKGNDTVIISAIQFQREKIVITKRHLEKLQFNLKIKPEITNLDEIVVSQHNLTGNFLIDAKNAKEIGVMNEKLLGHGAWDVDFRIMDDYDKIDGIRPPNPSKLTNPNIPIGGDVIGLLGLIFNPVIKEASKIGQRKRKQKLKKRKYNEASKTASDNIRIEFGDVFFIEKLYIPLGHIDLFLEFCKSKGLIDFFLNDQKIELIDLLFKESKVYINKYLKK